MNLIEFIGYGWKYTKASRYSVGEKVNSADSVCFVANKGTEKWILGAKARRLSKYSEKSVGVSFITKDAEVLQADGYFYLHHNSFSQMLQAKPEMLEKKNIVMFTHPVLKSATSARHLVFLLNMADKVIFLNQEHAKLLVSHGLKVEKTVVMPMASDAKMFLPHERSGEGKVVISMGYYQRKNPTLMHEIIRLMPHREFILIGKDWDQYEQFDEMKALPNFEYYDSIPYDDYPKLYAESDVFLSTSKLEGGPVPLLETMLCNLVPVASKTGFCVDIINHGENGFLFELDAKAEEVLPMIEAAYLMKVNARDFVIDYTWQNSAEKIDVLFN